MSTFRGPRCPQCGKKRGARRLSSQAGPKCAYCGTPRSRALTAETIPSDRYLDVPTETPEERGAGKLAPPPPTIPAPSEKHKTGPKVVN